MKRRIFKRKDIINISKKTSIEKNRKIDCLKKISNMINLYDF